MTHFNAGCSMQTVQYSHLYWGWRYRPETPSRTGHLLAAGYAVFGFDRISIGQSSRPPGAVVTIEVNAFVVHQLVRALRSGAIGETAFSGLCWWDMCWDRLWLWPKRAPTTMWTAWC